LRCAVCKAFEKGHVRHGGADVFWVVDAVAACCESCLMLLCFVEFHASAESAICDILSPV
jgi:hypothetical protein